MASSFHHFIESPDEQSEVLAWFRSLALPPEETFAPHGVVLYFRHIGPLDVDVDKLGLGLVDGSRSPVVNLILPKVRRSILWTTGAAHFLTMPIGQFPEMAKIRREFARWITQFPIAYDPKRDAENRYAYYLQGGAANRGLLYGLPSGMMALETGRNFVDEFDTEAKLDTVCRALRLRGVECGPN